MGQNDLASHGIALSFANPRTFKGTCFSLCTAAKSLGLKPYKNIMSSNFFAIELCYMSIFLQPVDQRIYSTYMLRLNLSEHLWAQTKIIKRKKKIEEVNICLGLALIITNPINFCARSVYTFRLGIPYI